MAGVVVGFRHGTTKRSCSDEVQTQLFQHVCTFHSTSRSNEALLSLVNRGRLDGRRLDRLTGGAVGGGSGAVPPPAQETPTITVKLNDLQLILLSTASNREDGNLLPAPDSVTADPDRVKTAVTSLVRRKLAMKSNDHIVITDAGRAAIGADETAAPEQADSATNITENNAEPLAEPAAPSARAGTKAALLMDLLFREGGATLDDLTRATGWLPHTVRAALSGLRKKGHAIASEKVDGVRAWRIVG